MESVGSRALGMGGAFVAVASDSTASWWNPAGQALGPFVDVSVAAAQTSTERPLPATRDRTAWFTLATPPFGFSYYRLQVTNISPPNPTVAASQDRQSTGGGVPLRSLSASQFGFTLAQVVAPGVHVGTTLKYVRGTLRSGFGQDSADPGALLEHGEELRGGSAKGRFDLDIGVMGAFGSIRLGAVGRNLRQPEFEGMRLPRQYRAGAAYDAEPAFDVPLTIAVDADLARYPTALGDRRVIAVGAEQWFAARRVGVRGGARFNTVGAEERAATAGISYALRSGLYLEGHLVRAGSADERGWGLAARVSF